MSTRRILQWLILAATAGLLILLKSFHIAITHYNVFLFILLSWVFGVIWVFRLLVDPQDPEQDG